MVASLTVIAACESAELITPQPCRGDQCTCEQDPQQLRCRGFSPDGSSIDSPEEFIPAEESGADAASEAEASIEDADAG
jgi:hypothetical protein